MDDKLHIGCGKDIMSGYVNLDVVRLPGVDVVHDINEGLPFNDGQFKKIVGKHIIEHVDNIEYVMKELYRILKPGGVLILETPHFTYSNAYVDPTHKQFFAYKSFTYFVDGEDKNYYFDYGFESVEIRLSFNKRLPYNHLVEWIANKFPTVYEQTPLRLFPAENIHARLTKGKYG